MAGFGFGNVGFVGSLGGAPPPAVIYRFNCGTATDYTDAGGNVWAGLSAGNFNYAAYGIFSPEPDRPLYEFVFNPAQTFSVPLPDGTYQISTRLRELFGSTVGSRTQSLRQTGETNTANYFFLNVDGYQTSRLPITYTAARLVTVTGGTLSLDLVAGTGGPIWQTLIFTKQ